MFCFKLTLSLLTYVLILKRTLPYSVNHIQTFKCGFFLSKRLIIASRNIYLYNVHFFFFFFLIENVCQYLQLQASKKLFDLGRSVKCLLRFALITRLWFSFLTFFSYIAVCSKLLVHIVEKLMIYNPGFSIKFTICTMFEFSLQPLFLFW